VNGRNGARGYRRQGDLGQQIDFEVRRERIGQPHLSRKRCKSPNASCDTCTKKKKKPKSEREGTERTRKQRCSLTTNKTYLRESSCASVVAKSKRHDSTLVSATIQTLVDISNIDLNACRRNGIAQAEVIIRQELGKVVQQHQQHAQRAVVLTPNDRKNENKNK
jgi:hypothetical protein